MSLLFSPIQLGGLRLRNRIAVSPMCQYSAVDGAAQPWHWQHLGSLALSGAGVVITEATSVASEGRISPPDLGLWSDEHQALLTSLIEDVHSYCDTPFGVQLAHAGRKASTARPWDGVGAVAPANGGWTPVGPTDEPFDETYPLPAALDLEGITRIRAAFVKAAERADACGFDLVELHGAHGYLLHEFYSPLSNHRADDYGGSFENRVRFALEIARDVRAVWPRSKALGMRITGSDWTEGGWTPEDAVRLAALLKAEGLDYVCVTSGGVAPKIRIPGSEPGYQVPFAAKVKAETGIPTMSVGMIVTAHQAEEILASGKADMVALARAMLDDPRWALHAAAALGDEAAYPPQYERAAAKYWPGYSRARSGD